MGILDIFGMIAGSVFSGGVTGLLGIVAQRVFDWLHVREQRALQKDKQAHEIELRRVDAEIMDKEWQGRARVAEVEAQGREAEADSHAFAASFETEPQSYAARVKPTRGQGWLLVLLDFIRGIVRPGLTLYLCVLTTIIYVQMQALLALTGGAITATVAAEMTVLIVQTVVYLTTTCLTWWFGTRNKQGAPGMAAAR